MKNIFVSIFFILLCVGVSSIFSACSKGEMPALQRADSLLCEDQAEEAARLLDSVKTAAEAWSEAARMRHALLSAEAQNKRFIPFTDDSLLLAVVDYYEKEGTPFDCMRAYYVMGSVYRDLKWNAQAQQYYHKAVEIADTTDTAQLRLLARVYGQLGEACSAYGHTANVLEIHKKQAHYGFLSKDTLIAAAGLLKQGYYYRTKAKYDSLIYFGKLAERLYAESSHKKLRPNALLAQIKGYTRLKDFSQADSLFKEFETVVSDSGKYRSAYLIENMKRYFVFKGDYFMLKGLLDSAVRYYRKELALGGDVFIRGAYNNLMRTYRKMGIKDSVIKYQRLYIKALREENKLGEDAHQKMYEQMQLNAKRQHTLLEMERSLYKTRVIVVTAIFLCVLTVLLFATFGFRRLQERRKKILALTNEYKFAIDNINENERQIRELESCNSSLETLVKSLRTKNEELEKQRHQIEAEYNRMRKNETDISMAAYLLEIKNVRDTFIESRTLNKESWQKLFNAVMVVSPGLIDFLKANNISINSEEYKICMLIVAGFKPQEIADALFMSKQNVSSVRKRMYNRIFNQEDGTLKDFDSRIRGLMQG